MSPGSPLDLLRTFFWIIQGLPSCTGFHHDIHQIIRVDKTLVKIFRKWDLTSSPLYKHIKLWHRRTFLRTHKSRPDLWDAAKMSTASRRDPKAHTKWREGCASDIRISTAPQRERFDMHKVTTGLRKHMLEPHPVRRAPRKMKVKKVKNNDVLPFLPMFQSFFGRCL